MGHLLFLCFFRCKIEPDTKEEDYSFSGGLRRSLGSWLSRVFDLHHHQFDAFSVNDGRLIGQFDYLTHYVGPIRTMLLTDFDQLGRWTADAEVR